MTRALAILARDVRERRFVFATAAICAAIPFLAAALPYARDAGGTSVIMMGGLIVSAAFTLAMAAIVGGSFLGRDLAERRLSFYFSKPVTAPAIWFGKLGAALATIVVCFFITFLPAFVVAGGKWTPTWKDGPRDFISSILTAAVFFLLIGHVVSTMIRSKSPLVAFDLSLAVASIALLWLITRALVANRAIKLVSAMITGISVAVAVAIVAAGVWQMWRGGTDIRTSHRELSRALWTLIAAIVGLSAAYVAWVLSAGPRDLKNWYAAGNIRADWVAIMGEAKYRGDYAPTFLLNVATGKWSKFASSMRFPNGGYAEPSFSRHGDAIGTIVPSLEKSVQGLQGELHIQTLNSPLRDTGTGIQAMITSAFALSDDLRSVAVADGAMLSVAEVRTRALRGSVRLPVYYVVSLFFTSPNVIRVYAQADVSRSKLDLRIYEFDVAARRLTQTGAFATDANGIMLRANQDGSAVVVAAFDPSGRGDSRIFLIDGKTGEQRGAIEAKGAMGAVPLTRGGVAFVDAPSGKARIRLFDEHGAHLRDIPLGEARWGDVREIVPGRKLLVEWFRGRPKEAGHESQVGVIDMQTGAIERTEHDLALRTQLRTRDPRLPDINPAADFIVVDRNQSVWRWNALTGAKKRVL